MNITTKSSLVGFLLAIAALNVPSAAATSQSSQPNDTAPTIEDRLSRLSVTIRQRESVLPENSITPVDIVARAWANGNGRAFVNGFNNGFRNGGGFLNYR